MKTLSRFLIAVLLVGSSAGCASQKSSRSAESEVLHKQALKALDNHRFIIRVDEFYPVGKPVKKASDSYMLMRDDRCEIKFSPDFLTGSHIITRDDFSSTAELSEAEKKKNGDREFVMKLKNNEQWRENKVLIILYENTNQCFVQFQNESNKNIYRLKGHIYPLAE